MVRFVSMRSLHCSYDDAAGFWAIRASVAAWMHFSVHSTTNMHQEYERKLSRLDRTLEKLSQSSHSVSCCFSVVHFRTRKEFENFAGMSGRHRLRANVRQPSKLMWEILRHFKWRDNHWERDFLSIDCDMIALLAYFGKTFWLKLLTFNQICIVTTFSQWIFIFFLRSDVSLSLVKICRC